MFTEHDMIFEPTREQRKQAGYYFARAYCKNCRYPRTSDIDRESHIEVMIPKGRTIPSWKYTCPNCVCRELSIY
jgi:hypothetical protein